MFNFTTQTVFNSIISSTLTEKGQRPEKNANLIISQIPTKEGDTVKPYVRIGNTRFDTKNVYDIQKKEPTPENLASVTFDMEDITFEEGEKEVGARIVLYIGLSMNSQDSFYANDLVYKGKPLYVEFKAKNGEDASAIAKRVKTVADKYLLFMTQEKILDISVSGSEVTISGVNGYQQIKIAKLQKFDPKAITLDCCTSQGDYVDIKVGVPAVYKYLDNAYVVDLEKKMDETGTIVGLDDNEVGIAPGIEAFGDYNWIIHNLRLPTTANTGFWAPTKSEMPAFGNTYVQFIVRLVSKRDRVAGEVVGQRAVSVTNHVLYVAKGAASDAVEAALSNLVDTIKTDADTKLADPYNLGTSSETTEPTTDNSEPTTDNSEPTTEPTEPTTEP